jgi:hypothetical protein
MNFQKKTGCLLDEKYRWHPGGIAAPRPTGPAHRVARRWLQNAGFCASILSDGQALIPSKTLPRGS